MCKECALQLVLQVANFGAFFFLKMPSAISNANSSLSCGFFRYRDFLYQIKNIFCSFLILYACLQTPTKIFATDGFTDRLTFLLFLYNLLSLSENLGRLIWVRLQQPQEELYPVLQVHAGSFPVSIIY